MLHANKIKIRKKKIGGLGGFLFGVFFMFIREL